MNTNMQLSMSTKIKRKKKSSPNKQNNIYNDNSNNYTVNLSLDLPAKTQRFLQLGLERSIEGEFTISKGLEKRYHNSQIQQIDNSNHLRSKFNSLFRDKEKDYVQPEGAATSRNEKKSNKFTATTNPYASKHSKNLSYSFSNNNNQANICSKSQFQSQSYSQSKNYGEISAKIGKNKMNKTHKLGKGDGLCKDKGEKIKKQRKFSSLSQTLNFNSLQLDKLQKNIMFSFGDDQIIGYTNPSTEMKNQNSEKDNKKKVNNQQKLNSDIIVTQFSNNSIKKNLVLTQNTNPTSQAQTQKTKDLSVYLRNQQTPVLSRYPNETFIFQHQSSDLKLMKQIKKIQQAVQEKKQIISFEYIKKRILMQACARKIQKAWRSYKTKKLINSYSNSFSVKLTSKMKDQINQKEIQQKFNINLNKPKILNVKSCGYRSGNSQMKKQIKQVKLNQINENFKQKQEKQQQQLSKKSDQLSQKFKLTKKIEPEFISTVQQKNKTQIQQIQKWQELIKQLRKNRDIEKQQKKPQQIKKFVEQEIANNNAKIKLNAQKDVERTLGKGSEIFNEKLVDAINKIENNQIKEEIQKNLVSLQLLRQKENKQIQNQKNQSIKKSTKEIVSTKNSMIPQKNKKQPSNLLNQNLQKGDKIINQNNKQLNTSQKESRIKTYKSIQKPKTSIRYKVQNDQNEQYINHASSPILVQQFKQQFESLQSIDQLISNSKQNHNLLQSSPCNQYYQSCSQSSLHASQNSNVGSEQLRVSILVDVNKDTIQNQSFSYMHSMRSEVDNNIETSEIKLFHLKSNSSDNTQNSFYKIQQLLEHICYNCHDQPSEKEQEVQNIVDIISTQLVCQVILQFKRLLKKFGYFYQYFIKNKNKFQNDDFESIQKNQKAEGICTNMESIKDYLQNFVAFIFDQHSTAIILGMNSSKGLNSLQILRKINKKANQQKNKQDQQSVDQNKVLAKRLFIRHWQYASQQIYFQKKYNDEDKQLERTKRLKQITKAIFDCFNQCLQQFRAYGLKGQPYAWQKRIHSKPLKLQSTQMIKPFIRLAFKRLSDMATIFCGLLVQDKKASLSKQMAEDIRQERMNVYLQDEVDFYNYRWERDQFRDIQAEILHGVSTYVIQSIFIEVCFQFAFLKKYKNESEKKLH